MAISDAKAVEGVPVGAFGIAKNDGTMPTIRYVPAGPNFLANGTLEVDASGWTLLNGATISRDTGTFKIGTASLKVIRGSANEGAKTSAKATVSGVIAVGAWVNGAGATLSVYWYDDSGASVATTTFSASAVGSAWNYLFETLVAPPTATQAELRLTVTSGTAYFDALTMQACVPLVETPFTEPTTTGSFAGGSLAYSLRPGLTSFLGDLQVYDMGTQTDVTLAASNFTPVKHARHVFTGPMLVDTGILRVQFKRQGGAGGTVAVSVLVHGSWQATRNVNVDTAGDTTAQLLGATLQYASRERVVVRTVDADGNSATFTFRRGQYAVQVDTVRVVASSAFQDFELASLHRFFAYNLSTVAKDHTLTAGTVDVTGSTLTEPGAIQWDSTLPYFALIGMTKKPTQLRAHSTDAWIWHDTAATTSAYARTFWVALVPWPWLLAGAIFNEAESGTLTGMGVSNAVDAAASAGHVAQFTQQNDASAIAFVGGRALPAGDYTLIMAATDNNHMANDLDMRVRNTTDSSTLATATKTLTASYAFYTLDFTLASTDDGDTIELRAMKAQVGVNTIKVDYFLIVPRARNGSTPSHVFFPKGIAHNALMAMTVREAVTPS